MPEEALWRTFFNPDCVVQHLDCGGPGDVIEFGCGYGTFTLAAAKLTSGTVHALDIDPSMIAATRKAVAWAGAANVVTELRDFIADGCGRPDRSANRAMLFNILHIEEPTSLLREVYRVLAPGGRLGVIHWRRDPSTPRGPTMEIRPAPEQCRTWAEEVGFHFIRYEDLPCCAWHWGMVLERPASESI
jgi:ubiquinone/menaquinone biosynthesis C-methylase UbiE